MRRNTASQGFALALVLTLVFISLLLLVVYASISITNAQTSGSSARSSAGFYASEAGLSARTAIMRRLFEGQNYPDGTPPSETNPCVGTNVGSGDFACQTSTVNGRTVTTYVNVGDEKPGKIPVGDSFENLTAFERPFTVMSTAKNAAGKPEAITNVVFRSRLVPLFQFAVFFDKDLEFSNTAPLTLSGPVHSNRNIFVDSELTLLGQVTSGANIFNGWKSQNYCKPTTKIEDASENMNTIPCNDTRTLLLSAAVNGVGNSDYGGRMKTLNPVNVPTVGDIQPRSGAPYWMKADARIVAKRVGSTWTPYFVSSDGSILLNLQTATGACTGVAWITNSFRDNREASIWDASPYDQGTTLTYAGSRQPVAGVRSTKNLLEINVKQMLACMQAQKSLLGLSGLDDTSDGGLVVYATLDDSTTAGILTNSLAGTLPAPPLNATTNINASISQTNPPVPNNYGVRFQNAETLKSSNTSDPTPLGITFASDQAAFVMGDYNKPATKALGWIPSAILADSMNILSEAWTYPDGVTDSATVNNFTKCSLGTTGMKRDTTAGNAFRDPERSTTSSATINNYIFRRGPGTPLGTNNGPTLLDGVQQAWRTNAAGDPITYITGDARSMNPTFCRLARSTVVRAAILAGTASTGTELALYETYDPDLATSGGVHNMMRFHEDWGNNNNSNPNGRQNFTYSGSLVSLSTPLHSAGRFWLDKYRTYSPPNRIWAFDQQFQEDPKNLPPLTPRFVTIKQENFARSFDQ